MKFNRQNLSFLTLTARPKGLGYRFEPTAAGPQAARRAKHVAAFAQPTRSLLVYMRVWSMSEPRWRVANAKAPTTSQARLSDFVLAGISQLPPTRHDDRVAKPEVFSKMAPHHLSLCRYPGGKGKLVRPIVERMIQNQMDPGYREPFFGGGAVGLNLMTTGAVREVWINNLDTSVFAMWTAASRFPEQFKEAVSAFVPSVEEFARIKQRLLAGIVTPISASEIVRVAVDKVAIQAMSWGGLGPMAGSPMGGWKQLKGGIASRWNAQAICRKIDMLSPFLRTARITNLDYTVLLQEGGRALVYLDPPYWHVGNTLYQHAFETGDHYRLWHLLRCSDHDWFLSYNDLPEVRELYSFADIRCIDATYSTSKRRTHELLITRPVRNRTLVGYCPQALAA